MNRIGSIFIFGVVAVAILLVYFHPWNVRKADDLAGRIEGKGKQSIVFANWASTETATKSMIDQVIRDFEKLNPDLDIINMPIPFDHYEHELIVLAMSGKAPDVIQLGGNLPALLGSMGVLEPIESFATRNGYLDDVYASTMKNAGEYEGTLYSVPFALTPHGFWYNKKLMEKAGLNPDRPPKTIEELNRHLEMIKEKLPGVYGIGIDTTMINYSFLGNFPYFQAFGAGDILSNPVRPGFDSNNAIEALTWFHDMIGNGHTPVDKQIKVEREMMAFDKIVYKLDGPYFEGIIRDINPALTESIFDDTFGVTVVPSVTGATHSTTRDIHTLGMSKQAKDKEAAWTFITFLTSSDSSVNNYIIPLGMIPAQSSSHTKFKDQLERPFMQTFIHEIIPTAKPMPYGPNMSQAAHYIMTGLQEVVAGQPPGQIAESVNEALIELYNKEQ